MWIENYLMDEGRKMVYRSKCVGYITYLMLVMPLNTAHQGMELNSSPNGILRVLMGMFACINRNILHTLTRVFFMYIEEVFMDMYNTRSVCIVRILPHSDSRIPSTARLHVSWYFIELVSGISETTK